MRTLLIALLWSCDSKNGDSASATDDSSPGGDDSASVDGDDDGVDAANDCNDADASIYPGADETIADGIDQDCDGLDRCYVDGDLDGYGDATIGAKACDVEGLSATGGDCDDTDDTMHPGAKETCDDPHDHNCDGSIEFEDADKDLWAACLECDDTDAGVNPKTAEIPNDGKDQDCDGGDLCAADLDEDGFGAADGKLIVSVDLDCTDPNEADDTDDCIDLGPDAAYTWPGVAFEDSTTECMTDVDGDGYGAWIPAAGVTAGSDCNDTVAEAHPGGTEVVGDSVDGDCNTTEICYYDADGDGYGGADTVSSIDADCGDAGEAATPSDCDDADPKVFCVGTIVEFPASSSHSADYLLGTALVVPTDMTMTALALIGKSATGNVRMALYTDSSGAPDALVSETASTSVPVGVLEMPVESVALPAGTYWIMAVFDTTASVGIAFPSKEVVQYRSLAFSDPMPATFGSPSTYTGQVFNYYIVGY